VGDYYLVRSVEIDLAFWTDCLVEILRDNPNDSPMTFNKTKLLD